MEPYYTDKNITIYNGDCREILQSLDEFDLLLTDPPYGIIEENKMKTLNGFKRPIVKWDKVPDNAVFEMILKKCNNHIIWGYNYFADKLGPCNGPLVWNKKTGNNKFADGELAWSDVTGTMRIFEHQWCGVFKDSERGCKSLHPTQKPIALMIWCIHWCKNVKTILDPFMGSGTTLRAAKDLGLTAVGIEKEEKYCEIAVKRLAQEVLF